MRRGWLTVAIWISLLGLGFCLGLQKIRTFDYWWQLRTGALIVETGEVPKHDVYTYTVPGARYIDIHWLHQLGLHGLHSLGGHDAVVVAKALMVCALIGILAPIGYRRERPWVSALGLGLMLLVAADRFMPRPELPSFLLLAAFLALLDRHERRRDAWVFAIVPLQLIWANVHGLFALGLAVCAIYLAAEVLRPLVAPDQRLDARAAGRLAAVTALGALVCLVNPNGLEGALYPIQQLGMIGPPEDRGVFGSLIAELIPPIGGGREHSRLAPRAHRCPCGALPARDGVELASRPRGRSASLGGIRLPGPGRQPQSGPVLDRGRADPGAECQRGPGSSSDPAIRVRRGQRGSVAVLALLTLDVARDRLLPADRILSRGGSRHHGGLLSRRERRSGSPRCGPRGPSVTTWRTGAT